MVNDGQNNAANPIHLHDFIADLSCFRHSRCDFPQEELSDEETDM